MSLRDIFWSGRASLRYASSKSLTLWRAEYLEPLRPDGPSLMPFEFWVRQALAALDPGPQAPRVQSGERLATGPQAPSLTLYRKSSQSWPTSKRPSTNRAR